MKLERLPLTGIYMYLNNNIANAQKPHIYFLYYQLGEAP